MIRNHPFKMSAFLRGRGQKLAEFADRVKKLPTVGGKGQKSLNFSEVLNGWSLMGKMQ